MPSPSLRELFDEIPKAFRNDAAYDLLEALVEAVKNLEERQELLMQCGITGETVETSWQILGLRGELAKAKAKIARLHKNAASEWHAQARQAYEAKCEELAEARAAVKNEQRKVTRLQGLFEDAQQMLAAPNIAYERQAADAEKWQLVLKMPYETRLVKGEVYFWSELKDNKGRWHSDMLPMYLDPAEALRSIQREKPCD